MDLGREVSLDEEPNFTLYIDVDADAETGVAVEGVGADLVWDLGAQSGEFWSQGVRTTVHYGDLVFRVAPSVVASKFELAFSRDARPYQDALLFPSNELSVVLRDNSVTDGDRVPDEGAQSYSFQDAPRMEMVDFSRADRTKLRVLSYNVERPGFELESARDDFERIFQAIQPDVIQLQEQDDSGLARTLINEWIPLDGGNWAMQAMTDKVTLSRLPFVSGWPTDRRDLDDRILATAIAALMLLAF